LIHTSLSCQDSASFFILDFGLSSSTVYLTSGNQKYIISVFHGNWNEDAEAFLNSYLEYMGPADDKKRARSFIYYLQADSNAEEWFEELPEEQKKSWATIEVLSRRKWLKQEVIGTKKVTLSLPQNRSKTGILTTQTL
jgi:hypothetical protein